MFEINELIRVFYDDPSVLGEFQQMDSDDLPAEYQRLLVHQEHMTVAMEAFHESLVEVDALQLKKTASHYARQIVLRRQRDGEIVQFGIMRVLATTFAKRSSGRSDRWAGFWSDTMY